MDQLIAALIRELPVALAGLMGIVNAIKNHAALTNDEQKAKLAELDQGIAAAAARSHELAQMILNPRTPA